MKMSFWEMETMRTSRRRARVWSVGASGGGADVVPDVVVDGGVVEVVVDGEEAGAYGAENQQDEDDAVLVGDTLEHVGGGADGVALVVGDAALLDIANDVRAGGCRGGGRWCAVWSSVRALRGELSLLEEEDGVPVKTWRTPTPSGTQPPEKTSAKRRRRNSVDAVRMSSPCDEGAEDDRRAAVELVSLQRRGERTWRRDCRGGVRSRDATKRDASVRMVSATTSSALRMAGTNRARIANSRTLCVGVGWRNGWPSAAAVTHLMTDAVSVARTLERPRQRWWGAV